MIKIILAFLFILLLAIAYVGFADNIPSPPTTLDSQSNQKYLQTLYQNINKLNYAEMWYHNDNSPFTVDLTQNNAIVVACFDTTTNAQTLNGFSYSSSALTCTVGGTYKATWNCSIASSTSNHKHHFWLAVNGVEQFNTENHCKPVNSTDVIACGGSGLLKLNPQDVVTFYVKDESSGGETLTVFASSINMTRIYY